MSPREIDINDRVQAWLGTAMMLMASALAVMIFCDRLDMEMFSLPAIWYTSRELHLIICGAMFLAAAILLKSPPGQPRRDGSPLFRSCRLLTRRECHLCEDALATLLQFQDALPTIEIVEIDDDAQLVRQFGESVPVVEIDGRVRFRGAVQPLLLKRLIDAAEFRLEAPCAGNDGQRTTSSGIKANG
jgi:glutaredoxin